MNRPGAFLLFLLALLIGAPAAAQQARHMEVRLVAETASVAPGSTVTLAFVMRPQPGWHGYWRNPGDAGAEPRVAWRLPEGWRAEPLHYPVPDRLLVIGLMNYVYERDYALLATVSVPADAEPGAHLPDRRAARLSGLHQRGLRPRRRDGLGRARHRRRRATPTPPFAAYRQALPRPLAAEGRFEMAGGPHPSRHPAAGRRCSRRALFLPGDADALGHSAAQSISRNGDLLIVETARGAAAPARSPRSKACSRSPTGVGLSLTARPRRRARARARRSSGAGRATASGPGILLGALLGALLGGLILNIMPCVFPILSLKALSLARAGETESGGAARGAGLCGRRDPDLPRARRRCCWRLRAGGAAVGWAFQLQDPRVILLLLLLVTAIALNLAGLFRLPALAAGDGLTRGGGVRGAFFTGALAAFVATPCTGPFMGAALGAALVLPAAGALAVFAGLGLGLALPFLLLGFVPALAPPPAAAGAVDGAVPAHPRGADVPDRFGPRLDTGPADRGRRHDARPRRGAGAGSRPVVAGAEAGAGSPGRWSCRARWRRCSCSAPTRPRRQRGSESPLAAEPFSDARLAAAPRRRAPRSSSISPPTGA